MACKPFKVPFASIIPLLHLMHFGGSYVVYDRGEIITNNDILQHFFKNEHDVIGENEIFLKSFPIISCSFYRLWCTVLFVNKLN